MTDKLISIQNLSKTYNDSFQALKNVSLDINKGEIFALLGPNGAGKTTLINIICGLVRPSSGSVMVNGADIIKDYKITNFSIMEVWKELLKKNNLNGYESFNTFKHLTNLETFKKLEDL